MSKRLAYLANNLRILEDTAREVAIVKVMVDNDSHKAAEIFMCIHGSYSLMEAYKKYSLVIPSAILT